MVFARNCRQLFLWISSAKIHARKLWTPTAAAHMRISGICEIPSVRMRQAIKRLICISVRNKFKSRWLLFWNFIFIFPLRSFYKKKGKKYEKAGIKRKWVVGWGIFRDDVIQNRSQLLWWLTGMTPLWYSKTETAYISNFTSSWKILGKSSFQMIREFLFWICR